MRVFSIQIICFYHFDEVSIDTSILKWSPSMNVFSIQISVFSFFTICLLWRENSNILSVKMINVARVARNITKK